MPTPDPSRVHAVASSMAKLLGETLIHHAPWTAEIAEETKQRYGDAWKEQLEQHTTGIIAPLIDKMVGSADMPDEVLTLLEHAARPKAQFGSILQQFFVFGLMFQLGGAMLAPFTQEVENKIWAKFPDRPLSPQDVATALTQAVTFGDAQGVDIPQWAIDEAAASGINAERFKTIVGIDGVAPDSTDLFEMFRRGIIDDGQFRDGFLEGPTKNKWIPFLQKLRYVTPTPDTMVRAAVQAQLPYPEAEKIAHELGLEPAGFNENNPDWFQILFDIAGRPPGPQEMAHAANRGIIQWEGTGPTETTFEQAIAESDVKPKWTPVLRALGQYFPPPSEVKTLLMHGGITADQAVALWKQGGIPEELAKAYAHVAQVEQVTQERALAKGEILQLLAEQAIDDKLAKELLAKQGYVGDVADYLIESTHDRYDLSAVRNSIRRLSTLYTSHKATATQVSEAFRAIGLPKAQVDDLMITLEHQRAANIPILTVAQIESAFEYKVITEGQALEMLANLGYQEWNAWALLSIKSKGPLPGEPPFPGATQNA